MAINWTTCCLYNRRVISFYLLFFSHFWKKKKTYSWKKMWQDFSEYHNNSCSFCLVDSWFILLMKWIYIFSSRENRYILIKVKTRIWENLVCKQSFDFFHPEERKQQQIIIFVIWNSGILIDVKCQKLWTFYAFFSLTF